MAGTAALCLVLSGCATDVHPRNAGLDATGSAQARPALPRPARVLVAPFAVDPDAVAQDAGIGARLQREMAGGDASAAQATIASDVQSALSGAVIEALDKAGLPAGPAPAGGSYRPGDLLVQGRIERIDEGNRTRRLAIGFGAGKSIVRADAQVSYVMPDGQLLLLQTYEGKSDSGRKPGMAAGAAGAMGGAGPGAAALSTAMGVHGEMGRSPVVKEGAQYGRRLAHEIGLLAAAKGWIAQGSVPAWQPL